MTAEQVGNLDVGDMFEAGSLFGGLTEEKMAWVCTVALLNAAQFEVSFMGIEIGTAQVTVNEKGGIEWEIDSGGNKHNAA